MADAQTDQFLWIGATGAAWQNVSDWGDVTTGDSPASAFLGAGSAVEIDGPTTVSGPAVTSTLTARGAVTLTGALTAQTLNLAFGATLTLEGTATTATVVTADPTGTVEALGSGAVLTITAPLLLPILFRIGSLGDGLPRRDLRVSPLHAVFLDGILILACHFVNDTTIVQERDTQRVDYFLCGTGSPRRAAGGGRAV